MSVMFLFLFLLRGGVVGRVDKGDSGLCFVGPQAVMRRDGHLLQGYKESKAKEGGRRGRRRAKEGPSWQKTRVRLMWRCVVAAIVYGSRSGDR
jgi:hypothetical protein